VVVEIALFATYVLGVTILVRGVQGRFLSEFTFFYSYLAYFLVTGLIWSFVDSYAPQYFVTLFWLRFFTLVLAEFALLVEIGDHLFKPYPALCAMGRLVTFGIAGVFFVLYILPALVEARPTDMAVLDLVKRSALTKGIILVALFAAARYYSVSVGRNVAGIALGLAAYLAIHTANFALAEHFGREAYAPIFATVGPLSQVLTLVIWTVALWRYAPAKQPELSIVSGEGGMSGTLTDQLGRYNAALDRLLRK
jgi:hypothetical protein